MERLKMKVIEVSDLKEIIKDLSVENDYKKSILLDWKEILLNDVDIAISTDSAITRLVKVQGIVRIIKSYWDIDLSDVRIVADGNKKYYEKYYDN